MLVSVFRVCSKEPDAGVDQQPERAQPRGFVFKKEEFTASVFRFRRGRERGNGQNG